MSTTKSMLVIDDEAAICFAFRRFFSVRGWEVYTAASADEGHRLYDEHRPEVVFLDVRLPDRSGLKLLTELGRVANTPIIVITAYNSLETTVQAVRAEAFDYLVKPLDLDRAWALAERARETRATSVPPRVAGGPAGADHAPLLIGNSPVMQEIYKCIARAAASSAPVLVSGATGTGKELVARAIHEHGPRRGAPFVAVNCGAIPDTLVESELFGTTRGAFTGAEADRPGRFELAQGGTLLFDEVSELPLAAQVKLLRVLDSQEVQRIGSTAPTRVNVRVIAAANKDLAAEAQAGRFRADLYYRLAVLEIRLPLLAERVEDIVPLAEHFLAQAAAPPAALSGAAAELLREYAWPGNVRELKNAIAAAVSAAPNRTLLPEDLPESVRRARVPANVADEPLCRSVLEYLSAAEDPQAPRYSSLIERVERTAIEYAMRRCHGRQVDAALYLGLHRNTLRNRIRELNLTDLKR